MIQSKATAESKTIKCPFCGNGEIDIIVISGFISPRTSRIAGKKRSVPTYYPEKIEVHNNCQNCGKSKTEIKKFLENGKKPMTHEERIEMLKKRGLPLVLGSK